MRLFQYIIPVTVKAVKEVSDKINLYKNYIPSLLTKSAQTHVVLEQSINDTVPIYSDAKDYIICQLRSTIQHEAMHRSQEMEWHESPEDTRPTFEDITSPSRAEVKPEQAEENCVPPTQVSGQVENVSIHDMFEEAKTKANIDPGWKSDILAASLASGVAGEYLMKSMSPDQMLEANQISPNVYRYGNKLLIDVRKQFEPWIAAKGTMPANVQQARDGAVTPDPDAFKTPQGQQPSTVPAVPSVPSVPTI